MKAIEWADLIPRRPEGYGREEYTQALARVLIGHGVRFRFTDKDAAGNCPTCGEAGRCPGLHTLEELEKAAPNA